ncbi:MAG: S1-like domain-containing RNA-binding protein [Pseudomonadota bacterium]
MIAVGQVSDFIVNRETEAGFYLQSISSDDEVLMPSQMTPLMTKLGMKMKAFVYHTTKGTLIATPDIPHACVGEYALLKAVDVQDFGAFFDWGLEKDLLVPGNEQRVKVEKNEYHLVRVCLEESTNRIFGTTKLGKHIEASFFDIAQGDEINIVPVLATNLGYKVVINKKFVGLIYKNEIFQQIKIGDTYSGVVKKLREDGLVDAALQAQGHKNPFEAKDKIIIFLKKNDGKSSLNDKSSPGAIKETLGMSKQTFKKAIGMLYKDRKIQITKEGIELKLFKRK